MHKQCRAITQKGFRCSRATNDDCKQVCTQHLRVKEIHNCKQIGGTDSSDFTVIYPSFQVDGQSASVSSTKSEPRVNLGANKDKGMETLILFDPDAPGAKVKGNQYLHWLITNISPDSDIHKGDIIASYMGPGPPAGSGTHRYIFYKLGQSRVINVPKCMGVTSERPNFNITSFMRKYGLTKVQERYFSVDS